MYKKLFAIVMTFCLVGFVIWMLRPVMTVDAVYISENLTGNEPAATTWRTFPGWIWGVASLIAIIAILVVTRNRNKIGGVQ